MLLRRIEKFFKQKRPYSNPSDCSGEFSIAKPRAALNKTDASDNDLQGVCSIEGVQPMDFSSFGRVGCVYDCPSQTGVNQRLFLFALVSLLRAERVLEIGFKYGGTALVIAMALEDQFDRYGREGHVVSLDPKPEPKVPIDAWRHRLTLLKGYSPDDVPQAAGLLGGPIDFCFIDGEHTKSAVFSDIKSVLPFMKKNGYILLHDAGMDLVAAGICVALEKFEQELVDCGPIEPFINEEGFGGLRLLRSM